MKVIFEDGDFHKVLAKYEGRQDFDHCESSIEFMKFVCMYLVTFLFEVVIELLQLLITEFIYEDNSQFPS